MIVNRKLKNRNSQNVRIPVAVCRDELLEAHHGAGNYLGDRNG